jgi:lipoate-protein ligase A
MMIGDAGLRQWRLLESRTADGYSHMALDQALLESASCKGFLPTLRFLRWDPPALSIGRFQDINEIDLVACEAENIDVVRRPTGGKCILHMDDFTYSLVLPPNCGLPRNVVKAYAVICEGILAAVKRLGLPAVLQSRESGDYSQVKGACFAASTQADLEYKGRKICGSAQVRRRGALLQHGSILLQDRSQLLFNLLRFNQEGQRRESLQNYRRRCIPFSETSADCTWTELTESFIDGFGACFEAEIEMGELSREEEALWRRLREIYGSHEWLLGIKDQV